MTKVNSSSSSSSSIYYPKSPLEQVLHDRRGPLLIANGKVWKEFLLNSKNKVDLQAFWFRLVDMETQESESGEAATFLAEVLSIQGGLLPLDLKQTWLPLVTRFSGNFFTQITKKLIALDETLNSDHVWIQILGLLSEDFYKKVYCNDQYISCFVDLWGATNLEIKLCHRSLILNEFYLSLPVEIRENPQFPNWYRQRGIHHFDRYLDKRENTMRFLYHPLQPLIQNQIKRKHLNEKFLLNNFLFAYYARFFPGSTLEEVLDDSPLEEVQKRYVLIVVEDFLRNLSW